MPYEYPESFRRLAEELGFADDPIRPLVHLRNPLDLDNWTLPVVESVMVGGAGLALARALQRWRAHDDPTHLAVWTSAAAYLLILEPPLYFPKTFHLPDHVGDVFAHNVFSVQFMLERLPLYIVALYPAMAELAYDIVQQIGGFEGNPLLGAAAVGFVHHLFYEIFDQLGPQFRWWVWNPDADSNQPAVAGVPMTSAFLFATVGPAALTLLVRLLVGRRADRGQPISGWGLAGRSLLAAALTPLSLAVGGLPASLVASRGKGAQRAVMSALIGLTGAVGGRTLAAAWRRTRAAEPSGTPDSPWFSVGYGSAFLAAFGALWAKKGLPDRLAAKDGVTPDGTPAASIAYSLACAALAAATLAGAATARTRAASRPQAGPSLLASLLLRRKAR